VIAVVLAAAVHPTIPDVVTFAISGALVLSGAAGVVWSRNPVHAALSLVTTLFGVAVLFIEQDADFLAAVQVIVYAGAVVVLFLFVIMFLGVDRQERVEDEPLRGQRPLAVLVVTVAVGGVVALLADAHWAVTGARTVTGHINGPQGEVGQLGRELFTRYLFAFEATAALLVIAVVGAVVLARRPSVPEGAGVRTDGPAEAPDGDGDAAGPVPARSEAADDAEVTR